MSALTTGATTMRQEQLATQEKYDAPVNLAREFLVQCVVCNFRDDRGNSVTQSMAFRELSNAVLGHDSETEKQS